MIFKKKHYSDPIIKSQTKVQKKLRQLQIHQIEIEKQNEELKRAQVDLELSRARYIDFYEFAPVGYLTIKEWYDPVESSRILS